MIGTKNKTRIETKATRARRYGFMALGLVLAALFAYYFSFTHCQRRVNIPNHESYTLDAACRGTAAPPFQYRILIPWASNALHYALPSFIGLSPLWDAMPLIELAETFALLIAIWIWLGQWTTVPANKLLGMLLSVNALMVTFLVPTQLCCFYWYDIPSILFFTIGLILIRKNKITWFYLLFLVATLNKETSCFLSVAFLVMHRQRSQRYAMAHLASQTGLWLVVKLMLYLIVGTDGPQFFWWTLPRNLTALLSIQNIGQFITALGFIPLAVAASWRYISSREAKLLNIVSILFVMGMFFIGYIEEIRIYGELLPIMLPACVLGLTSWLRNQSEQPHSQQESKS